LNALAEQDKSGRKRVKKKKKKKNRKLLSFAKVMKLVLGAFVWGRGGFSLPKPGRLKSPLPTRKR
jgi:predicted transcriptional regulator